jgi:hypothetical protein
MGLIREPLDVDFYVDSKPLTAKERLAISQHIRDYKKKMTKRKSKKNTQKKTASPLSK